MNKEKILHWLIPSKWFKCVAPPKRKNGGEWGVGAWGIVCTRVPDCSQRKQKRYGSGSRWDWSRWHIVVASLPAIGWWPCTHGSSCRLSNSLQRAPFPHPQVWQLWPAPAPLPWAPSCSSCAHKTTRPVRDRNAALAFVRFARAKGARKQVPAVYVYIHVAIAYIHEHIRCTYTAAVILCGEF
jgi:hypothetical protein